MPQIGHPAPDFTLPRDGGTTLTLSDLRPKAVVLYFYPKDDTKGCTTEAQEFTALREAFAEANTVVLGISKDSVRKHDNFIAKYDLGVILLSDAEAEICEAYGTWVEKSMYGKTYMGIARTTFLIDGTGVVRAEWHKVKAAGHAQVVLEAAQAL